MPPLAILTPSGASNFGLLGIDGNYFQLCPHYKQIELAPSSFAAPRLEHDSSFQRVRRRNQLPFCLEDLLKKQLAFGFAQEDRYEG